MKALIVCTDTHLAWPLPHLLARSGFTVDVVSKSGFFKSSAYVNILFLIPSEESVTEHAIKIVKEKQSGDYDWIIVAEDPLLLDILQANVSDDIKLKFLPVTGPEHFTHLHSKIGLADLMAKHGIPSPRYRTACSLSEAKIAAEELGYPVMLKVDQSSGGKGTYLCRSFADIVNHNDVFDGKPVLLQEEIIGPLMNFSSLFFKGKLISFDCSIALINDGDYGPSILRDYMPITYMHKEVAGELSKLGTVLGAHGFSNITCIQSGGKRYYFEADMRPVVWVDIPLLYGYDLAVQIKRWFETKADMHTAYDWDQSGLPALVKIPFFLRMRSFEILINRYHVWRYIPWHDRNLVLRLLMKKLFIRPIARLVRLIVPTNAMHNTKNVMAKYGVN